MPSSHWHGSDVLRHPTDMGDASDHGIGRIIEIITAAGVLTGGALAELRCVDSGRRRRSCWPWLGDVLVGTLASASKRARLPEAVS